LYIFFGIGVPFLFNGSFFCISLRRCCYDLNQRESLLTRMLYKDGSKPKA
jgi:hypothetical protein